MSKKDNNGTSKILNYLEQQNRPYSINDIFQNLHKDIGKTAVQKALDQLVQDGSVKEKTYGKQKVYVVNQDKFPPLNELELKETDAKINRMNEEIKVKSKEIQESEAKLKILTSSLMTEEALEKIDQLTKETEVLENKLEGLKSNQIVISEQEKERTEFNYSKMTKEWRKRRRMAMDILDAILDGYPKSKHELFEDIGIETDQDAGVSLPQN